MKTKTTKVIRTIGTGLGVGGMLATGIATVMNLIFQKPLNELAQAEADAALYNQLDQRYAKLPPAEETPKA